MVLFCFPVLVREIYSRVEMKQKKITFFLGGMTRGGAERVISILSKEYARRGWKTDIGVLLSARLEYEIDETTNFLDFTGESGSTIKRIPYWLRTIREYVKREKPDVIVSFLAKINAFVQLACLGLEVEIIVSERNDPRHEKRELPIRILNALLYPKAKKIVFQTEKVRSCFRKKIRENSCVIVNPIIVKEKRLDERKKKIVTAGRITKQKNHKLLINSFSEVSKLYPEYELWIYGDGELKGELEELCQFLAINEKVHFPGSVPDIHRQMADAEMFVLSSDFEGLSNALMEAMTMGLPCIATDCAGSDELICDGENGLIVPVGNRKDLSKAMARLIADKELNKKLGINAEISARDFSVDVVMEQWSRVIEG